MIQFLKAIFLWAMDGGRYARRETVRERRRICRECPERWIDEDANELCMECGCRINEEFGWSRSFSKVYYPREKCPLGKWPEEDKRATEPQPPAG